MVDAQVPEPATARRFAANALSLLFAQVVGKAASFAFVLLVTRALGPQEYGWFNFAASFVPLFLILGTWGLDVAIIRGVVADRSRLSSLVASGLIIRLGTGVAALGAALLGGIPLVSGSTAYVTLVLIGLALLLDEVTTLLGTVFNVFERTTLYATVLLVNRMLSMVLALVVVGQGGGILAVSMTYLGGSAGALAVATFVLRTRFPRIHVSDASRDVIGELVRYGLPIGVAGALNMALFRIDAVLLQSFAGASAVGMYGIAYRFFDSFLFIAYGVGQVAMPRIARLARTGAQDRSFGVVLGLVLAVYLPLAVGSLFTARWVIEALFTDRYAEADRAVMWLTWAGVFYAVAYLTRVRAVALGHRRDIAVIAGATLALNVALNVLVIPTHGFTGAAAVTFVSEVVEAGVLLAVVGRSHGALGLGPITVVPVIAAGAMALAMAATGATGLVAIIVGGATYATVAFVASMSIARADVMRYASALLRPGAAT